MQSYKTKTNNPNLFKKKQNKMEDFYLMQDFLSEEFLSNLEESEKQLKKENKPIEPDEIEDENCSDDDSCLMCGS